MFKNLFTILFIITHLTVYSQLKQQAQLTHNNTQTIQHKDFQAWSKQQFGNNNKRIHFKLLDSLSDQIGYTHCKYQQFYNEYPVAHAVLITHVKDGAIKFSNNNLQKLPEINLSFKLEVSEILKKNHLSTDSKTLENIELVILNHGDFIGLCYKYTTPSFEKKAHYFNAQDGNLIKTEQLTHYLNVNGQGETVYSGTQTISSDSIAPNIFRLRDYSRGNGIETYSLNNTTDTTNYIDFSNTSKDWLTFTDPIDQYALDAHWGASQTYDYFLTQHQRNSVDNQGAKLVSLLHYGNNFVNAFWDGDKMIYGDGNSTTGPLVSIDIVGHEITHGLTSNTAMLLLENEPGALNESFSDIFGVLIDWYARPLVANWTVGEEVSSSIRSLADPSVNNDPKFYKGTNWKALGGTGFGGIHSNNGVQNHWFYLLVNGGTGINEAGNDFNINGVGINKAAQIAYRNLTAYLTPTSDYEEARFYSILSAQDLFGPCSPEVEAVTNAWYAVGVGEEYIQGNTSDFEISYHTACKPFTVNFTNKSQNAESYLWDFGNGVTSTETSPSYTYNETGTYTIQLTATSNTNCGSTSIKSYADTIVVSDSIAAKIDTLTTCTDSIEINFSERNTSINWYSDSLGQDLIDTNRIININILQEDTLLYYEEGIIETGKTDFSNLGSYNFDVRYQLFDVYQPIQLKAVTVYAYSIGNRTIELKDRFGNILQTKTINITTIGQNRVTLNFTVFPGKDYQLGVSGTNIALGRSSGGVNYPYEIPNLLSIHRSNALNAGYSYYYFFYKWEVKPLDCILQSNQLFIKIDSLSKTDTSLYYSNGILFSNDSLNDYQWYDCEGNEPIVNEINSSFNPTENGIFSLIISNEYCNTIDTTDCFEINTLILNRMDNNSTVSIYPNPTKNEIHIKGNKASIKSIIIKDITGKIKLKQTNNTLTISLHELSNGIYFIEIETQNEKVIKKIEKI